MTASMLRAEAGQGVDCVAATPHFYASRISVSEFLRRRDAALEKAQAAASAIDGAPKILTGAEVYYFPGMGRAERLPELCVTGTDVILIEMPFAQWTEEVLRDIRDILQRQKLQVVLAHVERYHEFQKSRRIWDQVMAMPLTCQINAGALIKGRNRRRFCLNLLKEDRRVILGSDCHNMTSRPPNLSEARRIIEKKLGAGYLRRLDQTAAQLLRQQY